MRYKITITKIGTEVKKSGKEWKVVGEEIVSEIAMQGQPITKKNIMGYTPEIEKEVEYEREILTQEVTDLDLAAVIKAINKI